MLISSRETLCLSTAILLLFTAARSSCTETFSELRRKMNITNCKKLSTLEAELGWNYHRLRANRTTRVEILFGVPNQQELKWIGWGVNPGKQAQMVGTRAVIGIMRDNGTLQLNTYNVTAYTKLGCRLLPSPIDPPVHHMRGDSISGGYATLYMVMDLDDSVYDVTRLNHVWQVGYAADVATSEPRMHASALQNFDSTEMLNITSGESSGVGHHRRHLRMVHGILNIVGWGTLLPIGVIIARYFREHPFDYHKKWYFLHITCQIIAYILGTAGWGIGMGLGHASKHYTFHTHRLLAIFIFTFTTLQMLALRLRPKSHDEYRKYWDMYHHFLGYALLAVIAINMFHGIAIFKPNQSWKWTYIGILGALGSVALALEVYTWVKFIQDRRNQRNRPRNEDKIDTKKNEDKDYTNVSHSS